MEFHADDWFTITGRGPVAVISQHDRKTRQQKKRLINRVVIIDNVRYTVMGYEDCLVGDDKHECSYPLAILVKECKNQPPKAGTVQGQPCTCTCHKAEHATKHMSKCCTTAP